MATILYRKFKSNKGQAPHQLCEHLRMSQNSQTPLELSYLSRDGREDGHGDGDNAPAPERHREKDHAQNFTSHIAPCSTCVDEKKAMKQYRRKLVAGLFLPFSMQALDITIISGALPFIASDFHQLSQLNWIISAFNLCSAAFLPGWGQLADVFGRYNTLQTAILLMLFGSALCAAAPTTAFPMLLVGRAVQGIGCSGINIATKVILADKVSLKENAKNNTIFTIVGGIGYGIGPVIGGYLTQVSWRWCFIVNLPTGAAGAVLVHFVLRPELLEPQEITRNDGTTDSQVSQTFIGRLSTIDFVGQFLFLFGMGLLVLSLTWAGSYYPWPNVQIIAPLAIGATLLISFITWEYLMIPGRSLANRYPFRKAMVPLNLLCTRNVGILIYLNFITGMAMYAVFYFVDLYFTLVLQYGPGKAGTNIIYYLPGLAAGAYLAIFACNIYPRTTFHPLALGTLLEPLGITLLALAIRSSNLNLIFGMLALTGVGTGIRFMPGTLHGVGYHPGQIASIVSLILLSSSLGGTFATTIMLNIFNNRLNSAGIDFVNGDAASFDAIASMSTQMQDFLRDKARGGIALAFFAISAFSWLGVVLVLGLGNVNISKGKKDGSSASDNVVKGSYLGSLFRKRSGDAEA